VIWGGGGVGHSLSPFEQSYRCIISVCPVSPLISLGHSPPISVCSSVPTAVKYPGSEHCRCSHLTLLPLAAALHTRTQRIRIAVCGRSIQYWSRLRHHVPLRRSAFIIELLMRRLHVVGRGVGRGNMFSVAHTLS